MRRRTTALAGIGLMALLSGCAGEVDRPVEAHVLVAPEAPPPAGDPAVGRALFVSNCAACHGDSGEGGFGPDLTGSAVTTDHDAVVDVVTEGRGAMPAFGPSLSTREVEHVAAYVTAQIRAGKPVEPIPPSLGASPTAVPEGVDPADGAAIFAQSCASCHGDDGSGTDVAPGFSAELGFTDVQQTVMGGALGMPAFSEYLGAEDVDAVSAYVVSELRRR